MSILVSRSGWMLMAASVTNKSCDLMDGETLDDIDSFIYEHKMDLLDIDLHPANTFHASAARCTLRRKFLAECPASPMVNLY
jgi:hypothetical protein